MKNIFLVTPRLMLLVGMICGAPLAAHGQQPASALNDVVAKLITREHEEMNVIRQRSPMVETYIQKVRTTENDGSWQPDGDHYFMGRAELSKGLELEPMLARNDDSNSLRHKVASITRLFDFGNEFLPRGFLQMIFLDKDGLDTQNYRFDYVRREFLGDVRTFVFDVTPSRKAGRGRFIGRIWVEDQTYTIVRFNGSYAGHDKSDRKFHFDSWRVNAGPDQWLPAYIYSEEDAKEHQHARITAYKAQTRLWGYNAGQSRQDEELSQVLIESALPVTDNSPQDSDLLPVQEKRAWDLEAENNVIERFQEIGLIAPKGEVDKILETVVDNLEVTNNLNFDPDIRCRVLLTSTIESFTVGRTIVLSRGLIDVLPDEASLAAMLAKEVGYIMTAPQTVDAKFAFYDRLRRFNEKETFQHLDFARTPEEDAKASAKGLELLQNSPYKDQLGTVQAFVSELQGRSHEIPNLISPRVGDAALLRLPITAIKEEEITAGHTVALPLGGRIKLNPWDDTLELLKSKPASDVAEREKMPFEITPFMIYLTRVGAENPKSSQANAAPQPGT